MLNPKSEIRNLIKVLFLICILCIGISTNAYALNLDALKMYYLQGDYKQAIKEGERLVAQANHSSGSDELYYILALSYLKDGNYLRASDIFEIILNEFSSTSLREKAKLGLADTYFFRGDFSKAQSQYKDMLRNNPSTNLRPQIYYRLSRVAQKTGDAAEADEYTSKLKTEFPLNVEAIVNNECIFSDALPASFYSVQVGSFSDSSNAYNLRDKLIDSGYQAFIEDADDSSGKMYRVKVGKLQKQDEASLLADKLSREGYPTKICP